MLLIVRSDKPGSTPLTLVDGATATGYTLLLDGRDFGNAVWENLFSGPRGTQGARAVGSIPQNRPVVLPFRLRGSSKDDLLAKISALHVAADELRRFGGRITWRAHGQTRRQHFIVMAGAVSISDWPKRFDHSHTLTQVLGCVCAPYLEGDPLDITGEFQAETLGDYTFDAGASGNVAVVGAELDAVANLTAENRAIHTGRGYGYTDAQATVRATFGLVENGSKAGLVLKRVSSSTYLECYVDDNGTNSRVRIDKIVAGVRTNLASTNLASRLAAGVPAWIRGRMEGNAVWVEYFAQRATPTVTPDHALSVALTSAEAATFGSTVAAESGWVWNPRHTDSKLGEFELRAFAYRLVDTPALLKLAGAIPGDAPALADVSVTRRNLGSVRPWGLVAWWERQQEPENHCWNGDFDLDYLVDVSEPRGWSVAALTGFNAAATSITRVAAAGRGGSAAGRVVTPGSQPNEGARFFLAGPFRRGVTYTAELWIRSLTNTETARIRLGEAAGTDVVDGAATALTATHQKLSVTWTPTTTWPGGARVAVTWVNGGTPVAGQFDIDHVAVYEGTVAPTGSSRTDGRGGLPPLGVLEAEATIDTAQIQTDAGSRGGRRLELVDGSPSRWILDPTLATPDDHTQGEISIEVWARLRLGSSTTALTTTLSARALTSQAATPERYTLEFGSAGRTVHLVNAGSGSWRLTRLGTLVLPTNLGRWELRLLPDWSGGSVQLDYLVLVPANARALSPTGKPHDASFPSFLPSLIEATKRIRPDLSATYQEPTVGTPEVASPGLGGALLELPPGDVDLAAWATALVPDSPTYGSETDSDADDMAVQVAIRPRYHLAR